MPGDEFFEAVVGEVVPGPVVDTDDNSGRRTMREVGGGGGQGGDRGIGRGYCSIFNTLWVDPSATLSYAPGLEHHHPTMSMLGGHGCWLDIYIYIDRERYVKGP